MAAASHPQTVITIHYANDVNVDPFGHPLRLRISTKLS